MIWEVLSEEEKNRVLLKLLIHVCKADNIIAEQEFSYLIYVCKNLNLSPEIIREYAQDININEILPMDEHERMNILYHLLFIMNADSIVDPKEEMIIYQLAFKLGFTEAMTRDFILLMKAHKLDELPAHAMVEIIRKHNN
ncbi:MAG: hypothetical protein IPL08_12030 [Saprospiraceae bacterium]|nr:hypothetical protein [Saprospiraceae bacterium]MBK8669966.1 hypothetical protein [Saprospiraceae bacterium]MBL0100353.1 hypothetical protein [Saprospiraceae bacterium]